MYTCRAFDSCTAQYTGYSGFPQLNMLGNATFKHTLSFMGRQVDVWMYEVRIYETVCIVNGYNQRANVTSMSL